jgi:hypothetical protein
MELIRVIKVYPRVLVNSLDKLFARFHYFLPLANRVPSTLGVLVDIEDYNEVDVELITNFNGWNYLSPAKGCEALKPDPKKAIIVFPEFLDNKIEQQKLYMESLTDEKSAWLFKSKVIMSIINRLRERQDDLISFSHQTLPYLLVYRKRWRNLIEVGILVENSKNKNLVPEEQDKWIIEVPKFFNKDLGNKYSIISIPGFFRLQLDPWRFSTELEVEDPDDRIINFIRDNKINTKISLT